MMTNIQPEVNFQGRYSTKETCQLLGICRETLRKKVKAGIIIPHYRRSNLRPFFMGADIIKYWRQTF